MPHWRLASGCAAIRLIAIKTKDDPILVDLSDKEKVRGKQGRTGCLLLTGRMGKGTIVACEFNQSIVSVAWSLPPGERKITLQ